MAVFLYIWCNYVFIFISLVCPLHGWTRLLRIQANWFCNYRVWFLECFLPLDWCLQFWSSVHLIDLILQCYYNGKQNDLTCIPWNNVVLFTNTILDAKTCPVVRRSVHSAITTVFYKITYAHGKVFFTSTVWALFSKIIYSVACLKIRMSQSFLPCTSLSATETKETGCCTDCIPM